MITARAILYHYICDGCGVQEHAGRAFSDAILTQGVAPGEFLVRECQWLQSNPPRFGWTVTHERHHCPACSAKRRKRGALRIVREAGR